jgi:hypothetical protein
MQHSTELDLEIWRGRGTTRCDALMLMDILWYYGVIKPQDKTQENKIV